MALKQSLHALGTIGGASRDFGVLALGTAGADPS